MAYVATFVYNTVLAVVRGQVEIGLAVASACITTLFLHAGGLPTLDLRS